MITTETKPQSFLEFLGGYGLDQYTWNHRLGSALGYQVELRTEDGATYVMGDLCESQDLAEKSAMDKARAFGKPKGLTDMLADAKAATKENEELKAKVAALEAKVKK